MKNPIVIFIAVFSFLMSFPSYGVSQANTKSDKEIYVDVGRAGSKKLKLGIPYFSTEDSKLNTVFSDADLEDYTRRLENILDFTNAFDFIPQKVMTGKMASSQVVKFEEWSAINSDILIVGKFSGSPSRSTLELRLYDIKKSKILVGKKYVDIKKQDIDVVLRRFSDWVMNALTGEMGIFSTKIAFAGSDSSVEGAPKHIYIANFDGSGLQRVTNGKANHLSPAWSPDGKKLTYTSFESGRAEVWMYDFTTKTSEKLTNGPGYNSGAFWHPDGKKIALSGSNNQGKIYIYTMAASPGADKNVLITSKQAAEVEPAYSPDGQKIAFVSGRYHRPHIFVRDLVTGHEDRITYSGVYNASPSWSPNGKKIAYAGFDRDIDGFDIFIINPDGSQPERLTRDNGESEKPTWSPDGRFILYQSNKSENGQPKTKACKLYVMTQDGTDQKVLKIPLVDVTMPSWSPRLNELKP